MSDNDTSDQESDGVECYVEGCEGGGRSRLELIEEGVCPTCRKEYSGRKGVITHHTQSHGGSPITDDMLLAEIDRLHDELGRTPAQSDMLDYGKYSLEPYEDRFGGLNNALREAGYSPANEYDISDKSLLAEIDRLHDELGRVPLKSDITEYGKYGHGTYDNRFGGWNTALREAGYEPTRERDIPDESLLAEIDRLHDELGRAPIRSDIDRHGRYGSATYERRFGGWNNSLRKAGYSPTLERDVPDEDLLAEIHRLHDELGRTPAQSDMRDHGKYSSRTYESRFGLWTLSLEAAGLDPRTPEEYLPSGEDHPNWGGGLFPYGPGWNEAKKEQVRERDGRVCQNPGCDRTEEEHIEMFGKKHSVHHIQKARAFDDPEKRNHPDNLVTLCETKECHKRWEQMSPLRPQLGDTPSD